jgi:predicted flap endonuclease-1-like 5' DNA nuclease
MATIETIEGIGPTYGKKLRSAGVRSTGALLKRGSTPKGRAELAAATGFSSHQILEWANRADLMRVRGVGEEYSDLLEAAGVDTVKELRNRNAKNLTEAMANTNAKKKLVRRIPSQSMVERWVAHAKTLPPTMTY